VTGGIGWGRFGSRDGFGNPLGLLDDRFDTRPGRWKAPAPGRAGGGPWIVLILQRPAG
jgi:hypothetical protein